MPTLFTIPGPLRVGRLAGRAALLTLLMGTSVASATDVYLRAAAFDKVMYDGEVVPMWGFATCDATFTVCEAPTAPGPQIEVSAGDALTLHVDNQLPAPISIMVPGQGDGGDPVYVTDALGRQRVRSFTHEVAAGSSGTYTFASLRAGTFLYESGTYPSIQVPMGLYGALVVGPGAGVCADSAESAAYDSEETCYDSDTVLVFSELDPLQNYAVSMAASEAEYPVTVDYYPEYLLVNGESTTALPALDPGDTLLLRLLNAGLETHYPELPGVSMRLLAQDGYLRPGALRSVATAELPAGATLDLLVTAPSSDITLGLVDRGARSNFSNSPGGGAAVSVVVGEGTPVDPTPTVFAEGDAYSLEEDSSLLGDSVLANDVGLDGATVTVVVPPANGTLSMASDGSFTYSPNADFAGVDTFVYVATVGGIAYPATVTLTVDHVNDAPVAADDGTYTNVLGADVVVAAAGVLGNDRDADGDELLTVLVDPPATGTLSLELDGSFTFTGGAAGDVVTFTYMAWDGVEYSDPATVTLEILPVAGLALTVADPSGNLVTDYHWTVQEDRTFKTDPADPKPFIEMQAASFHKSHMPVIATGTTKAGGGDDLSTLALDPEKYYYVSVLPLDGGNEEGGHAMSGAPIAPGDTAVTVQVASHPIQTAQVSVLVFEDLAPVNGAWDGGEPGLGGYQITLEDAGGRYGANGGPMSKDAFGNPLRNSLDCFGSSTPPEGVILSCPDGTVLVKNLAPGKYGVTVNPPSGVEGTWIQTSTIEGTKVTDAWVMAGEPPFMSEWGPGPHVFVGFVNPAHTIVPEAVPAAERVNAITGNVTLYHDPRPPAPFGTVETGSYDALAFTRAWVGLNSVAGGGPSYATVQADTDGSFSIEGIPNGDYQLVIWDEFLDQIIGYRAVTLNGSGADLGHVPVFAWFGRQEHNVFLDANGNGVRDEGEVGLPEQNVNIRFRDGSIFQSFPTDTEGFVPFDEMFPFFSWLVAEVDFARFKATGLTVTVDGGGDTSASPYPGLLSVQEGSPRTETGPVLTEAFQQFASQTTLMDWGKAPYAVGENGGISGIVYYASTRAELNPRLAVGDPWERGLPGVTVRLYKEVTTAAGGTALTLVDETTTDSWDDSLPEGCLGEDETSPFVTASLGTDNLKRCYDGWRNYNQARPGIFDGGYAFGDIPPGDYIVEVVPPEGYELVKEEDTNVGYGDVFEMAPVAVTLPGGATVVVVPDVATILDSTAEPGLAQPPCVGVEREVPELESLFPDTATLSPFAGYVRPLCDRKAVHLSDQGQSAADFFLYTPAPIATQFTGLILDDVAMEHDQTSPNYSEKWAPSFLPVSIRDHLGNEVFHTYSDGYGRYNGLAASTYTANIPNPSGYSPAMYAVCLNSAGTASRPEPYRNENYGEICYTLQFMPGTTTYLDTPVLPSSAFSAGYNPVDCAQPSGGPEIDTVDGVVAKGGDTITISSRGVVSVPNPAWRGPSASAPYDAPFVTRDYGFGTDKGRVTLNGAGVAVQSWTDSEITFRVPRSLATGTYQLAVVNKAGLTTQRGVTVTVTPTSPIVVSAGQLIQDAVDAAPAGALILVEPGTYTESLVLWKPVQLQGSGAGSTIIEAAPRQGATMEAWRQKVSGLVDSGLVDVLPGQTTTVATAFGGGVFDNEMGAAVFVLAKDGAFAGTASRIDGFTIRDGMVGGGVVVNGYADDLDISNNIITRNQGWLGGGVRVGAPVLPLTGEGPYDFNPNVHIHHNDIVLNAATGEQSAGGGVTLASGSDRYEVTDNLICGNFTTGYGAGVGHLGLSDGGTIAGNQILFNQATNPTVTRSGGGVYVGGLPPQPPALTEGAGDVTVDRNRIQGNLAASGHGGGLRAEYVNGQDVEASATATDWYSLVLTNNLIVNNVATWAGGGVSLQDAARVSILHNTIAHNDSTATAGPLIDFATSTSAAQPAGVSSSLHTAGLAAALPAGSADFSDPTLVYNILWRNRSFHYDATSGDVLLVPQLAPSTDGECATGATYWDMGVLGSTQTLTTINSIMTVKVGATNKAQDPKFSAPYCNGARELGSPGPMDLAAAVDEGGNSLALRYGPLSAGAYDYHLGAGSPANNYLPVGPATGVTVDVDRQSRPRGPRVDAGADER